MNFTYLYGGDSVDFSQVCRVFCSSGASDKPYKGKFIS